MTTMQTITNKEIDLLNPTEDKINIYDIAHGLHYLCRYNGQISKLYTVAQHSVHCAEYVQEKLKDDTSLTEAEKRSLALKALLHDAHEAYLGDIVSPLKNVLPDYQKIENHLDDVISDKYNIPRGKPDIIEEADKVILAAELRDLFTDDSEGRRREIIQKFAYKYPNKIKAESPIESLKMFMRKFLEISEQ